MLILIGAFIGSMLTQQFHYNQCKAINFEHDVCKIEKKLSGYARKN